MWSGLGVAVVQVGAAATARWHALCRRRIASSFIASKRTCDSQVWSAFDGFATQSGMPVLAASAASEAPAAAASAGGRTVAGDEEMPERTLRLVSDSLSDSSSLMSRSSDASMRRLAQSVASSALARLDGGGEASGRK